MHIACTHDEATLLRLVCHKHGECEKCALEPFCRGRSTVGGNLEKLIYKSPKTALLITKGQHQVIEEEPNYENQCSGYTTTYSFTFVVDSRGHIIREDGVDASAISANLADESLVIG